MNGNTSGQVSMLSAYAFSHQVQASEHYTYFRLLTPIDLFVPIPVDALGFSAERLAKGTADAMEGRTRPFNEVMNGLRARVRGHSS